MSMKPEIKKLWVDALRSGTYRQTKGNLHTTEGHCCLGVLCDVAAQSGSVEVAVEVEATGYMVTYNMNGGYLPTSIVEWAGLDHYDPVINGTTLSERNDFGATFGEIADLIEEHL